MFPPLFCYVFVVNVHGKHQFSVWFLYFYDRDGEGEIFFTSKSIFAWFFRQADQDLHPRPLLFVAHIAVFWPSFFLFMVQVISISMYVFVLAVFEVKTFGVKMLTLIIAFD